MKKVEAQVLLQFIWCNKNKSVSILSLLHESVQLSWSPGSCTGSSVSSEWSLPFLRAVVRWKGLV